ncbi:MAG: hypothetical protein F6K16_20745 [Symploca sp. SIO2B6]|nr:hypothetical protein [Symploca sp. SIO2B6]
MKLFSFGQNNSDLIETLESEYKSLFLRRDYIINYRFTKVMLAHAFAFCRLIIRVLLNGCRPKISQGHGHDSNIYWYAYYPLSGISKIIASEDEIKQWLESIQEM